MTPTFSEHRILAFPDEFNDAHTAAFIATITSWVKQSSSPILVDFSAISLLYSSGLGVLVSGYKICAPNQVIFAVVNTNETIASVIHTTKLDKVFPVFSTLEEFEIQGGDGDPEPTTGDALTFSWEETSGTGQKVYLCKGVMGEGAQLTQFYERIKKEKKVILDFSGLSFIEGDCLPLLTKLCKNLKMHLFGVNSIVDDELRLFELKSKMRIRPTLKEILREY